MSFHVVVLSHQQVAAGALRFQDQLSEALMQRGVELGLPIAAIRTAGYGGKLDVPSKLVEIYALNQFPFERFQRVAGQFGKDASAILFFNDAAREACEMYGIQLSYVKEIPDSDLPTNLGVFLSLKHYGGTAP
jgi:hypothetical protein